MVRGQRYVGRAPMGFQYSLCRVVLMVSQCTRPGNLEFRLSVLALSSRFDGPLQQAIQEAEKESFSTRSVESF